MQDFDDERKLAWKKVYEKKKVYDKLVFGTLGFAIIYFLASWLLDFKANHYISFFVAILFVASKYYAQHKIDKLRNEYYKKYPLI